MTIRHEDPQVPYHLSPARLYFDEIEQIAYIFSEAARSAKSPDAGEEVITTFHVGTQFSGELNDLRKIGEKTRQFAVFTRRAGVLLRLELSDNSLHWVSVGLPRPLEWETFHKVENVIHPRKLRLSSLLDKIMTPTAQLAAVCVGLTVMSLVILRGHDLRLLASAALVSFTLGVASGVLSANGFLGGCAVILRYSHEQAERSAERRSKIGYALLGAILTIITGLTVAALKHKYWP